jgi:hypothetical protein
MLCEADRAGKVAWAGASETWSTVEIWRSRTRRLKGCKLFLLVLLYLRVLLIVVSLKAGLTLRRLSQTLLMRLLLVRGFRIVVPVLIRRLLLVKKMI